MTSIVRAFRYMWRFYSSAYTVNGLFVGQHVHAIVALTNDVDRACISPHVTHPQLCAHS